MLTGQQNLRAVCGIKVSVASPSGGGRVRVSPTRPGRQSFPCQVVVKESLVGGSPFCPFLTAMRTG